MPPKRADEGASTKKGSNETDRLFRSLTITILTVFHVIAVVAWLAPVSYVRQQVFHATRRYVIATKSDQAWPMFAPDPLVYNRRIVLAVTLASGETREIDRTTPLNRAMRSFDFERVGKRLKAHDRVISGGERQYERGFVLHECAALTREWGVPLREITFYRDFGTIELDGRSFQTRVTPTQRATVTTQKCPEQL